MVLQVMAVCSVILAAKHAIFRPLGILLLWLVVCSAIVSAVQYFQKFWGRVDGSVKQRRRLRILERRKNAQDVPTLQ
jgi:CDP-diacylglycerol---glycerol-3-phosphate 3-phosphatidyltransferase